MANQFDITPPDPIGALNTWKQEIAKTSYLESNAAIQKLRVGEEKDKATLAHDNALAEMAFEQDVKKIAPSLEPLEKLSKAADMALANGQFSHAEKILSGMAQIESRSALTEQRIAMGEKNKIEGGIKKMTALATLYQNVDSPESKAAADILYASEFGEQSPLARQPYTEGMNKPLQGHFNTALEIARADLAKQRSVALAAETEKKNAVREATIHLDAAREKEIDAKIKKMEKISGKIATPQKSEISLASSIISSEYPDMRKKDLELSGSEIASEAKMRLLRGQSEDFGSAVREIVSENPQRFNKVPEVEKHFWETKEPAFTEYKRGVKAALKGSGGVPKGVPPGSTMIPGKVDKASGKPVYRGTDGKLYLED